MQLTKRFLEGTVTNVKSLLNSERATNGPDGTVSNQSLKSVQMIYNQLGRLQAIIQTLNKDICIDLHSCLTTQVENLHAVGHFKDDCPTVLAYARNLGNAVYESVKRSTSWAAYYVTHPSSYYPIPDNSVSLQELSKLSHLGKTKQLNSKQAQMMREWAAQHGKCVRQRTVRQETTKFKAGTLPLNMYRAAPSDYPKEKIDLSQTLSPNFTIQPRQLSIMTKGKKGLAMTSMTITQKLKANRKMTFKTFNKTSMIRTVNVKM